MNKLINSIISLLVAVWFIVFSFEASAGKCYAKDDVGLGGEFLVPAAAEPVSSDRYFLKKARDDTTVRLLRTGPDKGKQFISWLDTGLIVNVDSDKLVFYVEGAWSPWGQNLESGETCKCIDPCSANGNPENICASGGMQVSNNYEGSVCYKGKFSPCTIQADANSSKPTLYGLYGLIAASRGSSIHSNPNNKLYWDNLPPELFRTFQILPDASGFFTISQTQSCIYKPGDAEPTCTLDTVNSLSSALNEAYKYPIMQGKLYLKIMDGYYEDNSGAYNVVVSYGAVSSIGVIESAIKGFEDTIVDAANAIRLAVSGNSSILEITRALLFFYIAINGLLFAMGMLQSNASELVKRLFKIGIIATAISPAAFDFFNVYIFSLIKDGFYAFSEMILDATHDPSNPLQASFAVAAGQTPLSVYDKILNAVTSNALHVKIWSLLFFKWGGVYIIAIYIGIFYILLALTKTVMMYIIATINMAILISLFPFFIVMILFEITKSFFDSWIKSFLANAVTIMLIFASIAIIMTLLFGLLQNLLAFKVCWKPVWDLPLLNKLYFWIPSSYSDVKNAVTMVNVLAFVIVAIVFDKFTSEVPTIGEAITGGSSGIKSAFEALSKVMKKALNAANALNPIGLAINRYNAMKNGEYSSTKTRDKLPISKGGSGKNGEGSDGKFKDGGKNPAVNKALAPHITPLYNPSQTVYYPTNVPILNGAPVNPIPAPVNLTTTPVNPIPAAEPPTGDTKVPLTAEPPTADTNVEPSRIPNEELNPRVEPIHTIEPAAEVANLMAMKDTMDPNDYFQKLAELDVKFLQEHTANNIAFSELSRDMLENAKSNNFDNYLSNLEELERLSDKCAAIGEQMKITSREMSTVVSSIKE